MAGSALDSAEAQVSGIPKAHLAVFMGTEFDALTGRGDPGEPVRMPPWGGKPPGSSKGDHDVG